MVHRAPPHPGHRAAGWPPDIGPDPPPRPAPAAIDAKHQCPRRPACHRVPRLARLYRPGSHQCHLRTARGRGLPARYRPGQLPRPRPGHNLRIHHDNGETTTGLAVSLTLVDISSSLLTTTT